MQRSWISGESFVFYCSNDVLEVNVCEESRWKASSLNNTKTDPQKNQARDKAKNKNSLLAFFDGAG